MMRQTNFHTSDVARSDGPAAIQPPAAHAMRSPDCAGSLRFPRNGTGGAVRPSTSAPVPTHPPSPGARFDSQRPAARPSSSHAVRPGGPLEGARA